MTNRNAIIEQCKETISYRAQMMALEYDANDIIVADCGDGNDCVFLNYYIHSPVTDEDGNFVYDEDSKVKMQKLPNMWIDAPLNGWFRFENGSIKIQPFRVHISIPQLVFLVHSDGTIKDGAIAGKPISFMI